MGVSTGKNRMMGMMSSRDPMACGMMARGAARFRT